jgi:SAM-dependent methyltransferase
MKTSNHEPGAAEADAARWVAEYVRGCDHPDFRAYAGDLADGGLTRFLWLMRHVAELAGLRRGDRVLDVGSGFGWEAVAVSLQSGVCVVANDIRPMMTEVTAERTRAVLDRGAPVCVDVLTGDICALRFDPGSFDAVLCNQTIEHVHDLGAMLRTSFEALKPGGRLVITNDNNLLNHKQLEDIRRMWARRDADWSYIDELKQQRPEENRAIRPYASIREEIVRAANPGIGDDDVRTLVGATAGLVKPEIERAALSYPAAELPVPPAYSWCRDPLTGEYCERQLDPFEVAAQMRQCGFDTQVRHGFRRWPVAWLNGAGVPAINRWLFQINPFFILVGVKPG